MPASAKPSCYVMPFGVALTQRRRVRLAVELDRGVMLMFFWCYWCYFCSFRWMWLFISAFDEAVAGRPIGGVHHTGEPYKTWVYCRICVTQSMLWFLSDYCQLFVVNLSGDDVNLFLFADDAKIFQHIINFVDVLTLQSKLDKFTEWTDKWLVKLNVGKCKNMSVCHN